MKLTPREHAREEWLRTEVAATYDAMKADQSRAVSIAQARAHLAKVHETAKGAW